MSDRPILYLEPVGGIAGDMFLAAALDLGVSLDELTAGLASLKVEGWHFERNEAVRHAIKGTHLDVVVEGAHAHRHEEGEVHHTHGGHAGAGPVSQGPLDSAQAERAPSHGGHPHAGGETAHSHDEGKTLHSHGGPLHTHSVGAATHPHDEAAHGPEHHPALAAVTALPHRDHGHPDDVHAHARDGQAHEHRSLKDIEALIAASALPLRAKERATCVFRLIGAAEAKVHGVPVETIAFHEVGAVDSIVDVCGAALVLELLGDPQVFASPPPLGSGTVRIAHGVVPVPVPATLEILRGVPVLFEGKGELTTPTGAALLKAFAQVGAPPPMTVDRIGYGVGTKDFPDRANVLRASLGRAAGQTAQLTVLECNLDDCSPQVLGALLESVLEHGALDAWVLPAVMKKSRPGHLLGVLCDDAHRATVETLVLRETTTLGVRATRVGRTALERRFDEVQTPWGPVKVKVGLRAGEVLNAAPEFEDCRALAKKAGVPLKEVQAAALSAWRAK